LKRRSVSAADLSPPGFVHSGSPIEQILLPIKRLRIEQEPVHAEGEATDLRETD
jgi:hypothetical protein